MTHCVHSIRHVLPVAGDGARTRAESRLAQWQPVDSPDDGLPGELDVVRVRRPLPEHNIDAGAVGTVVLVHDVAGLPLAYEVEFCDPAGMTLAIVEFGRAISNSPGVFPDRRAQRSCRDSPRRRRDVRRTFS